MAYGNRLSLLDEDDEDRSQDWTAYDRLPLALLESAVGPDGMAEIARCPRYCLVVQAPGADWVMPLYRALKPLGDWRYVVHKAAVSRSKLTTEDHDERVVLSLSEGDRVLGVSQDPLALLPAAMLASADRFVVLPQPSSAIIDRVITEVTGRSPGDLPEGLCAGLGFDEIVGCIRVGASAAECVDRLRRAAESKRRIQTFGADVPEIKDLHGYGEAQRWALDLIDDLAAFRQKAVAWEDLMSRVVLASTPGLGKTSFARSLARSTGLPLIATSVAQWFSNSPGYLDSVIKQIDEVFTSARAVAPAIVFLDEIDAVPNRSTMSQRGADWWTPVITHLLTTLDGTNAAITSKLIIVGATNHPEKLDEALVRPGRLSRIIRIGSPDERALVGIFRQHLGADLAGMDLSSAARLAHGSLATGAMVVEWVKSARRMARSEKRPITMTDLLLAVAPLDQRSEADRRRTAVHEGGHALVAHLTGNTPLGISMIEGDHRDGFTIFENGRLETRSDIEDLVTQLLAGRAAEEMVLGDPSAGAGMIVESDLGRATKFAGAIHLSAGLGEDIRFHAGADDVLKALAEDKTVAQRVEADLRRLYIRAMEMLVDHRPTLEAVTEELMLHRYVARERFLELVGTMSPEVRHG